jgi:hypothetical protein
MTCSTNTTECISSLDAAVQKLARGTDDDSVTAALFAWSGNPAAAVQLAAGLEKPLQFVLQAVETMSYAAA